jgi:flagellar basal-body rod protein FlgC
MESIDRFFGTLRTAATALSAERVRMGVIAENIAGAQVTRTPEGGPYRRKLVVFEPLLRQGQQGPEVRGVRAARIENDTNSQFVEIYDPGHPDADPDSGKVLMPNVNTLSEMADLITSMRAYEANLATQEGFVRLAQRALEFARS